MNEIYTWPVNDYRNYLAHHGILGMKWGIRRFQNPDGSLTPEGRERYGYESNDKVGGKTSNTKSSDATTHSQKTVDARSALEKGRKAFSSDQEYLKAISADCLAFDAGPRAYLSEEAIKRRGNEAAKLGIRALAKIDPSLNNRSDLDLKNPDSSWKTWFIYEDQTIGMGLIADLVNQGYTAEECSKLIDAAHEHYPLIYSVKGDREFMDKNPRAEGMIFDLDEGDWNGSLKTFAKACRDVRKADMLADAKNDMYNIDFLETVQNDIVLRKGGKELQNEYKKFIDNPRKYRTTFTESTYQKNYKNTPEVREAMRIAKAEGWEALSRHQKDLLNGLA